jgi:hypothetical protein
MATYWQCQELSVLWFGTSQLVDIVMLLDIEAKHAAFILEHDVWCRRRDA